MSKSMKTLSFISAVSLLVACGLSRAAETGEPGNDVHSGAVALTEGVPATHMIETGDTDWFKFQVPFSGIGNDSVVRIMTFGADGSQMSNVDTMITVTDGTGDEIAGLVVANVNGGGANSFAGVELRLWDNATYKVKVMHGGSGDSGIYSIVWDVKNRVKLNVDIAALSALASATASLTISNGVGGLTEGSEDADTIIVNISGGTFVDPLVPGNWTVNNLPAGVTVASVVRDSLTQATITLAGDSTVDYDADITDVEVQCTWHEYDTTGTRVGLTVDTGVVLSALNESIAVSGWVFHEDVANDGSIATTVTLTLTNDVFTGPNGLFDVANFAVLGEPAGLVIVALKTSDTTLDLSLAGNAAAHSAADSVSNLSLAFADAAFGRGNAATVFNSALTNLVVDFINLPATPAISISNGAGSFVEGAENGAVIDVSLIGAIFTATLTDTNWTVNNLPSGVTVDSITRISDVLVQIALIGDADADYDLNILNVSVDCAAAETDAAVLLIDALGVAFEAVIETVEWSNGVYTESGADDGSIANALTVTLTGDIFTGIDAAVYTDTVEYTVANVPAGLSVEVVKTSDSLLTITLTGTATDHANADDIADLTITLNDAAFVRGGSATIVGSSRNDLVVDFIEPTAPVIAGVVNYGDFLDVTVDLTLEDGTISENDSVSVKVTLAADVIFSSMPNYVGSAILTSAQIAQLNTTGALAGVVVRVLVEGGDEFNPLTGPNVDVRAEVSIPNSYNIAVNSIPVRTDRDDLIDSITINWFSLQVLDVSSVWVYKGQTISFDLSISLLDSAYRIPDGSSILARVSVPRANGGWEVCEGYLTQAQINTLNQASVIPGDNHVTLTVSGDSSLLQTGFHADTDPTRAVVELTTAAMTFANWFVTPRIDVQVSSATRVGPTAIDDVVFDGAGNVTVTALVGNFNDNLVMPGMRLQIYGTPDQTHDGLFFITAVSVDGLTITADDNGLGVATFTGVDLDDASLRVFRAKNLEIRNLSLPTAVNYDSYQTIDVTIRKVPGAADTSVNDIITILVHFDYAGFTGYQIVGRMLLPDSYAPNNGDITYSIPFYVPNTAAGTDIMVEIVFADDADLADNVDYISAAPIGAGPQFNALFVQGPDSFDIGGSAVVVAFVETDLPLTANAELSLEIYLNDSINGQSALIASRTYSGNDIAGIDENGFIAFFELSRNNFLGAGLTADVWDMGWEVAADIRYNDPNSGIVNVNDDSFIDGSAVTITDSQSLFDLVVGAIDVPTAVNQGDLVNVNVNVSLADTGAPAPNTTVSLYVALTDSHGNVQNESFILTAAQIRSLNDGETITFSALFLTGSTYTGIAVVQSHIEFGDIMDNDAENNWLAQNVSVNPAGYDVYPSALVLSAPLDPDGYVVGESVTATATLTKTGVAHIPALIRPIVSVRSNRNDDNANVSFGTAMLTIDQVLELNATGSVAVSLTGTLNGTMNNVSYARIDVYLDFVPGETVPYNNTLIGEWIAVSGGSDLAVSSAVTDPLYSSSIGESLSIDVDLTLDGPAISVDAIVSLTIRVKDTGMDVAYYRLTSSEIATLNATSALALSLNVEVTSGMTPDSQFDVFADYEFDINAANNTRWTNRIAVVTGADIAVGTIDVGATLVAGNAESFTVELLKVSAADVPATASITVNASVILLDEAIIGVAPQYSLSVAEIAELNASGSLTITMTGVFGAAMHFAPLRIEAYYENDPDLTDNVEFFLPLQIIGNGGDLALDILSAPSRLSTGSDYTVNLRVVHVSGEMPSADALVPLYVSMRHANSNNYIGRAQEAVAVVILDAAQLASLAADGYVDVSVTVVWGDIESTLVSNYETGSNEAWYVSAGLPWPADVATGNNGPMYASLVSLFDVEFVNPTSLTDVEIGSQMTVEWTVGDSMFGEPVRLEVSHDDGVTWTIVNPLVIGSETYDWTVAGPANIHTRFRISDFYGKASVVSDAFTVSIATSPFVAVLVPNGGEIYGVGDVMTIEWAYGGGLAGGTAVSIGVSADNFVTSDLLPLASAVLSDGSAAWTVTELDIPSLTLPSGNVKVRIIAGAESDVSDGLFMITDEPVSTLSAAPASVAILAELNDPTVSVAQVILEASAGAGNILWSAASPEAWLSVSPKSGFLTPGGTMNVSVAVDASTFGVGQHTGTVSFASPSRPTINVPVTVDVIGLEVLAPNGGEYLARTIRVQWSVLNEAAWPLSATTVDVDLYYNDFYIDTIATDVSLSTTGVDYSTLAVPSQSGYKVRVAGNPVDLSNSAFTIDNAAPVINSLSTTSPEDGARVAMYPVTLSVAVDADDALVGLDALPYQFELSELADFSTTLERSDWLATSEFDMTMSLLAPDMTYYWRVWVRDSLSNSAVSTGMSFSTTEVKIFATNPSPADGETFVENPIWIEADVSTSYLLTALHAQPYRIDVSTASDFSTIEYTSDWFATMQIPTDLVMSETYYWRVWVRDAFGNEMLDDDSFSFSTSTVLLEADVIVLEPNGGDEFAGTFSVSWSEVNPLSWNATTVNVYIIDGASSIVATVATAVPLGVQTADFSSLSVSDGNDYRLVVEDAFGIIVDISDGDFLIDNTGPVIDSVVCDAPSNSATGIVYPFTVEATAAATDALVGMHASSFAIEIAEDALFTTNVQRSSWAADPLMAPVVDASKTYYWRVIARDALGNETASTDVFTFTTSAAMADPSVQVLYPNGGEFLAGDIQLSWTVGGLPSWSTTTVSVNLIQDGVLALTIDEVSLSQTGLEFDTSAVADGAGYQIEVIGNFGGAVDLSDATFVIDNTAPVFLSITDVSPTGVSTSLSPLLTAVVEVEDLTAGLALHPFFIELSTSSDFLTVVRDSGWTDDASYQVGTDESLLGLTTYFWRITVADRAGNETVSPTYSFTTMLDTFSPAVVSVSPANNAKGVSLSLSAIVITFSEPMDTVATEAAVSIFTLRKPTTMSWSADDRVLTITLSETLVKGVEYTVMIDGELPDTGVMALDKAGNPLLDRVTSRFKTTGKKADNSRMRCDLSNDRLAPKRLSALFALIGLPVVLLAGVRRKR